MLSETFPQTKPLSEVGGTRRDWDWLDPCLHYKVILHCILHGVFVQLCFAFSLVQMEPIFECRTPPASPEVSRLVTKRRCPFGESPQPQKLHVSESNMARSDGICAVDSSSSGKLRFFLSKFLQTSECELVRRWVYVADYEWCSGCESALEKQSPPAIGQGTLREKHIIGWAAPRLVSSAQNNAF